jgi:hypothetical protein
MRYELGPEDDYRMKRLSEEVQGRLEEMSLLAARVAGIKLDREAIRKFVPHQVASAEESLSDITMVEIFDATSQHPQMCVVWHSSGPATLESPCGTPI